MTDTSPLGILLVNLGTPDTPTAPDIRRYLAEFLSDPRVVTLPRILWLPILYAFILPLRPKKLVEKYESIWSSKGAPIRYYTEEIAQLLNLKLKFHVSRDCIVRSAMTYGKPSIEDSLGELQALGAEDVVVLPMFPQYSASTTAAVLDKLNLALNALSNPPSIRFITDYHNNDSYIQAIANSLLKLDNFEELIAKGDTKVIFSFHGLPQVQVDAGDPYALHCETSARLVAKKLGLNSEAWQLSYQSRFGPAPWLKPNTSDVLEALPANSFKNAIVICPGFSVDCLETLEEIDQLNRDLFLKAGGFAFHYIPALNAEDEHINLISNLLEAHLFKSELLDPDD